MTGFLITRLRVTGPNVPAAELDLAPGLNVIAGPSDTGKTFIAQCLDFIMGAGTPPKEIPEAKSYDSIQLELKSRADGKAYTLRRGLRGGDIVLVGDEVESVLAAKHIADSDDTVSSFLLRHSGFFGKQLRKNARGEKRTLSFRDLARLIFVDEESVIQSSSPIHSGESTLKTAETSVFRLVLTGMDDSAVVEQVNPKLAKSRQEGQVEILRVLLGNVSEQIGRIGERATVGQLRDQLKNIDAAIQRYNDELTKERAGAVELEVRRRNAWTELRQAESKLDVLSQLQKKFLLLQDQYNSDLNRLGAISEAGARLGQLRESRCPVCGAEAEHHSESHKKLQSTPEEVSVSSNAEAAKIKGLVLDLKKTIEDNASEISRLEKECQLQSGILVNVANQLKTELQPRLESVVENLRLAREKREELSRIVDLHDRASEFEAMLAKASVKKKKPKAEIQPTEIKASEAEYFSQEVEFLLRSWNFPDLDRVTFSEVDEDVVVSGRPRGSHGKGVRAIIRAAFNLGLLRFTIKKKMPFPGLILIDSPLVVYREPDPDEGAFPHEVKDSFYNSLAGEFRDSQVVILENDDPPEELGKAANIIKFTGTDRGRRGFIPQGE